MNDEQRFSGKMGEDYELVRLAYPDYDLLQTSVATAVAEHAAGLTEQSPVRVIELGCGDGATTRALVEAAPSVRVEALDLEARLVQQAREKLADLIEADRVQVEEADATAYLRALPDKSVDIIATALTLHNFLSADRDSLLVEIARVIAPGGRFINADKYAPRGQERFKALMDQLERFFDAFVPIGKFELLQEWVLHNVDDQSPDHVMFADDALQQLRDLGFDDIAVSDRIGMMLVVNAGKR